MTGEGGDGDGGDDGDDGDGGWERRSTGQVTTAGGEGGVEPRQKCFLLTDAGRIHSDILALCRPNIQSRRARLPASPLQSCHSPKQKQQEKK